MSCAQRRIYSDQVRNYYRCVCTCPCRVYASHDSLICVTWPTHMRNTTHSYAWHTQSHVWHDSITRVTWLCVTWLSDMRYITPSYAWHTQSHAWHDPLICVHTQSHAWHDPIITRVAWLISIRDMTHSCSVYERISRALKSATAIIVFAPFVRMHHTTHSYVRHDLVICATWRDMTY